MAKERLELKELLQKINKKYGVSIASLSSEADELDIRFLRTGVLAFDVACGGGIPLGRMSMLFGEPSAGKTSMALKLCAFSQRYCRSCHIYMTPTGKTLLRCPVCGSRSKEPVCASCTSRTGAEVQRIDYGDVERVCASCGTYNPPLILWVDAEHVYSNAWAVAMGIDPDFLVKTDPEYAEQAVDSYDYMLREGDFDIAVFDSLAALTTLDEIEQTMEKAMVGGAAKLTNRLIKKATAVQASKDVRKTGRLLTQIFINQVRMKIGCLSYRNQVTLADGRLECIGRIVENRMPVSVLSLNTQTGIVEAKPVVGWFNNGPADRFIKLWIAGGRNGKRCIEATPDHRILTPSGERCVDALDVGDTVLVSGLRYFTSEQHEMILGSVLGDGCVRFEKNGTRGYLRVGHGSAQAEYCKWKAACLGCSASVAKNGTVWFETDRSEEFQPYGGLSKKRGQRVFPQSLVDRLTARAVAIWYCDDGSFSGCHKRWGHGKCFISAKSITVECLCRIASKLEALGLGKATVISGKQRGLLWSGENSRRFQEGISRFVHSSMRHKLKGDSPSFDWVVCRMPVAPTVYEAKIIGKFEVVPKTRAGVFGRARYDIEVEDNHNYVAGGIVVHNCMFGDPTVKPGGRGQEFATSLDVKLWSRKYETDEDTKVPYYHQMGFVTTKNKCGMPKREGSFPFWLRSTDRTNNRAVRTVGDTEEPIIVLSHAADLGIAHPEVAEFVKLRTEHRSPLACEEYAYDLARKDELKFMVIREQVLEVLISTYRKVAVGD